MSLSRSFFMFGLPATLFATAVVVHRTLQHRRSPAKDKLPPVAPLGPWEVLRHLTGSCWPTILLELGRQMGSPVYRLLLPGFNTMYVLNDSELILKVLHDKANDKSVREKMAEGFTGNQPNIFSSLMNEKAWHINRRRVSPAFSISNLNKKTGVLERKLEEFCTILDQHAVQDIPVDINDLLLCFTLDFISQSAFGYDLRAMHDEHSEGRQFLHGVEIALPELLRQQVRPWRKWMFWLQEVAQAKQAAQFGHQLALRILKAYRDAHSADDITTDSSILAHLIRNTHYSSEEARAADVVTLLFAGHDTTAHALAWAFYELSRHPEIQQQLQDELDASAEDLANGTRQITQLGCLNRCLKESMRLWPVVTGVIRVMSADLEAHGMTIPKGSTVRMSFINSFRSTWLEDPDEYKPKRWINPEPALESLLIPFSTGPRTCLGLNLANMELRAVLAKTLRRFSFELVQSPTPQNVLTLKPKGLLLRVKRRIATPSPL